MHTAGVAAVCDSLSPSTIRVFGVRPTLPVHLLRPVRHTRDIKSSPRTVTLSANVKCHFSTARIADMFGVVDMTEAQLTDVRPSSRQSLWKSDAYLIVVAEVDAGVDVCAAVYGGNQRVSTTNVVDFVINDECIDTTDSTRRVQTSVDAPTGERYLSVAVLTTGVREEFLTLDPK